MDTVKLPSNLGGVWIVKEGAVNLDDLRACRLGGIVRVREKPQDCLQYISADMEPYQCVAGWDMEPYQCVAGWVSENV